MDLVVAIPVAAGDEEGAMARDAIASVRAFEPAALRAILVVDDGPPRAFAGADAVIENPRHGRGVGAMGPTCAATLAALRWVAGHAPGAAVLRLDADALAIAPFAQRARAALAAHPEAGVHGRCDTTIDGTARDVSRWAPLVRKHAQPVTVWRRDRPHVVRAPGPARAVRAALAAGHPPGRHAIAGACLIAPALAARAAADQAPRDWVDTRIGDDVMLGVLAAAQGLTLRDDDLFGAAHRGLPAPPQELLDRGFALVHSLKGDPAARAFFAERRP